MIVSQEQKEAWLSGVFAKKGRLRQGIRNVDSLLNTNSSERS